MKVVVTGGGTVAPIDEVRQITNVSSGRFSASLSEACLRRGASVWHVHSTQAERPLHRASALDLERAGPSWDEEVARLRQLSRDYQASRDRLRLVPLTTGTVSDYAETLERTVRDVCPDVILLAMAVSDYEPEPIAGKIDSSRETLIVRCRRTPKVIRFVRDWAPSTFLVGFKLLTGSSEDELIATAREACVENRADATLANDLRTLRAGRHRVHLVRPNEPPESFGPGNSLADDVIERVFTLATSR